MLFVSHPFNVPELRTEQSSSTNTYFWTDLDLERERDLDSERLEARDGLGEPDLLSDLA